MATLGTAAVGAQEKADICLAVATDTDFVFDAAATKLTVKVTHKHATTTPAQAAAENLFVATTAKFFVNYIDEAQVLADHFFPGAETPAIDGATTTMGSVLAAVSLFALAAW